MQNPKLVYQVPELKVYGKVSELTQASGDPNQNDSFNGFGHSIPADGSVDGCIVLSGQSCP